MEQLLAMHKLTPDQLMGLVRRAITDELGKRRAHLPPDDFEDLHSKLIEMAIGLAHDHDPTRSTLSLATRVYRTARLRTISEIRDRIRRDSRHTEDSLDALAAREHVDDALLDTIDISDLIVTKAQRQAWTDSAQASGLTLAHWLVTTLDAATLKAV